MLTKRNQKEHDIHYISRVNLSIVSLKWGDVLSTLLPGMVALFAIAPYFPALDRKMENLENVGLVDGIALLIAAAFVGGLLEAFTRITWERFWLVKRCRPKDVLGNLSNENIDLYERGVQSSYKYVTFYANSAWAIILLLVSRLHQGVSPCSIGVFLLIIATLIFLFASHVQWTYFVNYQTKVFGKGESDAEKRPTTGNEGEVYKADS